MQDDDLRSNLDKFRHRRHREVEQESGAGSLRGRSLREGEKMLP
jgi:hypothetical protein